MTATVESVTNPTTEPAAGLMTRSFTGLLVTQFLGAMNDNMFRWLVIPIGMSVMGEASALMLGTVLFTAPYLVLANFAGFLADRFDKRLVIVSCKVAEIVLMLLGIIGIAIGSIELLFLVVMLMGCQSALFGPAKFGSIPEMVRSDRISAANGVMGLVTVTSAALGTFFGLALYQSHKIAIEQCLAGSGSAGLWDMGGLILAFGGTALFGWLASLQILRLTPADPDRQLPKNPLKETWTDLKYLVAPRAAFAGVLGIAFFWMLASLAQNNITLYGKYVFGLSQTGVGAMLVVW